MERSEIADGYLAALGLARATPDPELLTEITRRHVATFAFSSIGPRLGDDLPLCLSALYERIVVRRRGGYCFEQNGLLFEVLEELGYSVHLYLARVVHNQDIHPPLTHRVTVVDVQGVRLVIDVGFGPFGPPVPVPFAGEVTESGGRVFKVVEPRSGELHMQTFTGDAPYSLYRFDLARYGQADCEVGHFYSHRHPRATFVNNLVASLILEDEIRSLRNREYRVIRASEEEVTAIADAAQLERILVGDLGLRVTEPESFRLFEALPMDR